MKKITILAILVAITLTAIPMVSAGKSYNGQTWSHSIFIDIGDSVSEAPYTLDEWGTPATWQLAYYGTPVSNLRILYGPSGLDPTPIAGQITDNTPYATITIQNPNLVESIVVKHLDGSADDGFSVYVNDFFVGTYVTLGNVNWQTTTFPVPVQYTGGGTTTIKLKSTALPWSLHADWGQVAIDWIEINMQGHENYAGSIL